MAPGALLTEDRMCQADCHWNFEPRLSSTAKEPCKLPVLDEHLKPLPGRSSLKVNLHRHQPLRAFCEVHRTSEFNVLRVAWGLVLRCYTGNDTICFGYGSITECCDFDVKINDRGTARLSLYTDTILASDTLAAMLARFPRSARVWNERTTGGCIELLQPPFDTVLLESVHECKNRPRANDGVDLALSQVHFVSTCLSLPTT